MVLANEIPRLDAGESLVGSLRVAYGTGSLPKGAARSVGRGWEREANAGRRRRKARKLPLPVFVAMMRQRFGLAIEIPPEALADG